MNDSLLQQASKYLDDKYVRPVHTVAAAIEAESGNIYLGVNIDHFSGYVCAETSALAEAMNAGEMRFKRIATVRREKDGHADIANACGKCRQILHDYAPGIELLTQTETENRYITIEELLPYSFKRQREKIEEALDGRIEEIIR